MVQPETLLKVVDNSGAKLVKCIKVKGKGSQASATVGDIVLVSVQTLKPSYKRRLKVKVSKSEVHHAVIVQTRYGSRGLSGVGQAFCSNSAVLITPQLKPLGTRISAVLPQKLRLLGWGKLTAMAKKVI